MTSQSAQGAAVTECAPQLSAARTESVAPSPTLASPSGPAEGVPSSSSADLPPGDDTAIAGPAASTGSPGGSSPASSAKPKRKRKEDEKLCAFCHEGEDSDDPDDDPIVQVPNGKKSTPAHEMCLWWCPDIYQAEDLSWQNLSGALRRCARLKCAVCGEGHAPLGCKRKACKKNWHYPCAMEPTTGLVVYEEEYCVACPICHEVMERRARKQEMIAAEKKRAKDAAKEAAKAQKSASAAAATSSKQDAAAAATRAPPPQPVGKTKGKSSSAVSAAPRGGAKSGGSKKAAPSAAEAPSAWYAPAAPPPPPAAPPTPPPAPPPPDPRIVKAEAAIAALFAAQRCEDLPLSMVREAAGLDDAELNELLERMDKVENKLMCRAGSVYLI